MSPPSPRPASRPFKANKYTATTKTAAAPAAGCRRRTHDSSTTHTHAQQQHTHTHLWQVPVEDCCIGLDTICNHGLDHAAARTRRKGTADRTLSVWWLVHMSVIHRRTYAAATQKLLTTCYCSKHNQVGLSAQQSAAALSRVLFSCNEAKLQGLHSCMLPGRCERLVFACQLPTYSL